MRPFGHLLIDFDPKASDVLRFWSNIVAPQPTIFYIPSSTAKETLLTNEREKIAYTEALAKKTKRGKTFLALYMIATGNKSNFSVSAP